MYIYFVFFIMLIFKLIFIFYNKKKTNLINNHPLKINDNRPITFLNINPEKKTDNNTRNSTSNIKKKNEKITKRSSRTSKSKQTTTPKQSKTPLNTTTPLNTNQISLNSQHSSRSLLPITTKKNT